MDCLEFLRSGWAPKTRRRTELIVPKETDIRMEAAMKNLDWAFCIPYAFRDALDIKYEQRKKEKTPYMIWTQGTILNFKEGDTLSSKDGKRKVQVIYSSPMGWDSSKGEMYEGNVVFDEYKITDGKYAKLKNHICTQMQFLKLLIDG